MLEGRAADLFIVSSAMSFVAPVADQVFAMRANARIADLAKHERFAAASDDMVSAIAEGMDQDIEGEPVSGNLAKAMATIIRLPSSQRGGSKRSWGR